jgi:neutral trehalase
MVNLNRQRLLDGARAVLAINDTGNSTKPAPTLYPHQWNWDSCFIAIGLAHYNPPRAATELVSLLRGQWRNGMVPQIVFNPQATGYFPGPEVWQSQRSPHAPRTVATSGITQPPLLATAALAVYRNDPDRDHATAFVRAIYPRILAYHEFLYRERDPDGSDLAIVVHPWESGLDNSPPYLDAGSRVHLTYRPQYTRLDTQHVSIANRPSDKDYDLFVWLLEQMRMVDYDWQRYLHSAPLQVHDVLFNSILCQANADLAALAEIAGYDPSIAHRWHARTSKAINQQLWDETDGAYYSYDRVADCLLKVDTIVSFLPLYASIPPPERAKRLVDRLRDPARYWPANGFPVPTVAINSPWFNAENYWLGPVWVNTNWLVIQGLERYGQKDLAAAVESTTLALIARSGYREYFNPLTGAGYGTDSFSWTAALTIDLLADS